MITGRTSRVAGLVVNLLCDLDLKIVKEQTEIVMLASKSRASPLGTALAMSILIPRRRGPGQATRKMLARGVYAIFLYAARLILRSFPPRSSWET